MDEIIESQLSEKERFQKIEQQLRNDLFDI